MLDINLFQMAFILILGHWILAVGHWILIFSVSQVALGAPLTLEAQLQNIISIPNMI
jgi:hypothetical protein